MAPWGPKGGDHIIDGYPSMIFIDGPSMNTIDGYPSMIFVDGYPSMITRRIYMPAWHGTARHGTLASRHGTARQKLARLILARDGTARSWHGTALARHGTAKARHVTLWV